MHLCVLLSNWLSRNYWKANEFRGLGFNIQLAALQQAINTVALFTLLVYPSEYS